MDEISQKITDIRYAVSEHTCADHSMKRRLNDVLDLVEKLHAVVQQMGAKHEHSIDCGDGLCGYP